MRFDPLYYVDTFHGYRDVSVRTLILKIYKHRALHVTSLGCVTHCSVQLFSSLFHWFMFVATQRAFSIRRRNFESTSKYFYIFQRFSTPLRCLIENARWSLIQFFVFELHARDVIALTFYPPPLVLNFSPRLPF